MECRHSRERMLAWRQAIAGDAHHMKDASIDPSCYRLIEQPAALLQPVSPRPLCVPDAAPGTLRP
jgi:hypothetical protein